MDLTKELLAGASFRAKGKWYAAQQVDAFLEELSVRLEEDAQSLLRQVEGLPSEKLL